MSRQAVWSTVLVGGGELCATIIGEMLMLLLCVASSD